LVVKYHEYWDLLSVDQHSQFQDKLKEIIFKRKEREKFYDKLLEIKHDVSIDTFKEYFELYSAERKSNQQDFTPDSITKVITDINGLNESQSGFSAYDPTAGTGTMIIAQWDADRMKVAPWFYYPHNYFYMAEELSDQALIYLLHNLTLRGMNAIVLHGDSLERKYKQVYFIQNSKDDHMLYSDINVMPRSEFVENALDIREWTGEAIEHIESQKVVWYGMNTVTDDEQMTLFKE
jgi:hypothetical protein